MPGRLGGFPVKTSCIVMFIVACYVVVRKPFRNRKRGDDITEASSMAPDSASKEEDS